MAAKLDLEEQRDRSDDERLFFYFAVTAPSDGLILSYPRSADDSDTLPSFYLDEVHAAFAMAGSGIPPLRHVTRTLADVAPQASESVNEADRTLAACADLFDPAQAIPTPHPPAKRRGRPENPPANDSSSAIRALLQSRNLPRLPRFDDASLQVDFAENKSVYSVTGTGDLSALPVPIPPAARPAFAPGRRRRRGESGRRAAWNPAPLFSKASAGNSQIPRRPTPRPCKKNWRGLLDDALAKKPLDAAPHRARMMARTLHDALDGFAQRDARFTPHLQTAPAHFELAFGVATGRASIADEEREVSLDSGQRRETDV